MNFERGTIKSSPYIGVFASVTEEYALVPLQTLPKELKLVEETLGVKPIKTNIGGTSLLGVLSKGKGNKVIVSGIAERSEVKELEKNGLEVLVTHGYSAIGNLIALNDNGGIFSSVLREEEKKNAERFFGVQLAQMRVANHDIVGAAVTVTNKGFICHPSISEQEFAALKKTFGVKGVPTTANYGDLFVGNSVIGNSKGVLVGTLTSGIELTKIDEGMRGE